MAAYDAEIKLAAIAAVSAIEISVLVIAKPAGAVDGADKGRELAERLCAWCHMAPGQGEKQGTNEIPGFAAVARRRNQSHKGIVDWLGSIPPMMPNHRLSQDEMHVLAAYIMTLRERSSPDPRPQ
jgi:mono/diheme cytochrome c family protein